MKVPQVSRPQGPLAATLTAAPMGLLEASGRDATGKMPFVTKTNDNDVLRDEEDSIQALIANVQDAFHLGCSAVGITFCPGSAHQLEMHGQPCAYAGDTKRILAVAVWFHPRGSVIGIVGYECRCRLSSGRTSSTQSSKLRTSSRRQASKVCDEQRILIATSAERVRHVIDGALALCRIVIFSSGAAALDDDKWLDDIRAIYVGEELGPIIGCRPVQRPKDEAIRMLVAVMDIYAGAPDRTRTC